MTGLIREVWYEDGQMKSVDMRGKMKIKLLCSSFIMVLILTNAYAEDSYQSLKNNPGFYLNFDKKPGLPITLGHGLPSLFLDPNLEDNPRFYKSPIFLVDTKGLIKPSDMESPSRGVIIEESWQVNEQVDFVLPDDADKDELAGEIDEQVEGMENTNLGGFYLELGAGYEPNFNFGGEIGGFIYLTKDFFLKGGLAFFASGAVKDLFGGLDLGAGTHILGKVPLTTSLEISPYLGLGSFLGYSEGREVADDDNRDNDDDGDIDESGEEEETIDGLLATIYPEMGVHFWWNNLARVSFSAKYSITTEGRKHDFWMYGWTIAIAFTD